MKSQVAALGLMAAIAASGTALSTQLLASQPALPTAGVVQPRRGVSPFRPGASATGPMHRWPGPGWSYAHVQRTARKRRNQLAHRAACKRSRRGARA